MAHIIKDRVRETTTTEGATNPFDLSGAAPGAYDAFGTHMSTADTCWYTCVLAAVGEWEVGLGTYNSTSDTLARTTVLASSNSGNAVDFSAGTKDIWIDMPSAALLAQSGTASPLTAEQKALITKARAQSVLSKSADYTAVFNNNDALIVLTGSYTLSLDAAATLGDGWRCFVRNDGVGTWTIDPNSSETIDGVTTTSIYPRESFEIRCNGTGFYTVGRAATALGTLLEGDIFGLTLSNNDTDPTNDIDITTGRAAASNGDVPFLILIPNLASAPVGKKLDADWASGSNAGMRYSGAAISNGTYHIFVGCKADGTYVDLYAYPDPADGTDADSSAFASTVLTAWQAETGGSSYTYLRRVFSLIRGGGFILPFIHDGDYVGWKASHQDMSAAPGTTSAFNRTMTVPSGVRVMADLNLAYDSASYGGHVKVSDLSVDDEVPALGTAQISSPNSAPRASCTVRVLTNYHSQIRVRSTISSGVLYVNTIGYWDRRNRIA